ncbi:MAG: protein rep [Lachnospiraceae bacterium]|nr:protein rep [Lachnospiraceae bacterium]
MEMQKSQEEKILKDLDKQGKVRDWRGKKMSSLDLAKVYEGIAKKIQPEYDMRGVHTRYRKVTKKIQRGEEMVDVTADEPMGLYDKDGKRVVNYEKRAGNMKFCGSCLEFAKIADMLKLIKANFCRIPLCPMCQWRKSMRTFFEVSKIMSVIGMRNPNYVPVFLTLTVKNCLIENLGDNLDSMFKGWNEFMKNKLRDIVKGWFRALEITYDGDEKITQQRYNKARKYYDERGIKVGDKNENYNTFHPHFHVIMLVERKYFKGKDYMYTKDWVQLWRKSARLDYDPVCDIRRTRTSTQKRKEVAEVAKYTYKDAEILSKKLSEEKKEAVVENLSGALHGRRLYAYGGIMKEIAAELKLNEDKADLVNVNDDAEINPSLATMIVTYNWNMGVSNYIFTKRKKVIENSENL